MKKCLFFLIGAAYSLTVTAPVVDRYCWETLQGRALDTGANLKQNAFLHTAHCLYEEVVCRLFRVSASGAPGRPRD